MGIAWGEPCCTVKANAPGVSVGPVVGVLVVGWGSGVFVFGGVTEGTGVTVTEGSFVAVGVQVGGSCCRYVLVIVGVEKSGIGNSVFGGYGFSPE